MGHDRDGEIRRQLADVFHLQPDRGLQFFARFCRFLQTPSLLVARNGPPPLAIRTSAWSDLRASAFGYPLQAVLKRRE
ncbi:hypothetical protein SAMN05443247_08288 [Bradyrhizobium erythrophlei]|jgi:hypothetical protein|nr:hypothetical protein SAMN05443247_08288 [Bradyrhizobium erythrophlei]